MHLQARAPAAGSRRTDLSLVGISGGLLGGLIASAVDIGGVSSFFNLGTLLVVVGGAILLLLTYEAVVTYGGRADDRRIGDV